MEYSPWTKNEIDGYNRNYKRKDSGQAYLAAGILNDEPHKRLEYLIKKLNVSELEQNEISKGMKEGEDKGYFLGKLEDKAMVEFF